MKYEECSVRAIPDGVRFDVTRRNDGQIVEIAYGGFGAAEHGRGDPWMRIIDRSVGPGATYYRRVDLTRD